MSSYGGLWIGSFQVSRLRDGVDNELLVAFRDDMLVKRNVLLRDYYPHDEYDDDEPAEFIDVYEFRAEGHVIAERLDALGVTPDSIADHLDYFLHDEGRVRLDPESFPITDEKVRTAREAEEAALDALTPTLWLEKARAAAAAAQTGDDKEADAGTTTLSSWRGNIGSLQWLLSLVTDWFPPYALRAALLVFPDHEVRLDITELVENGWLPSELDTTASDALSILRAQSGPHAPIVVLTEGRTDAEFLAAGLELLFPHLTDLVKFLDYEARPEGGVGALVRLVHSFAAAGIANRVVAIFDNDTAATEALRGLNRSALPPNIVVTQYPDMDELRHYPTLGSPTSAHPNGTHEHADVNGMAASIELYLGQDVLTDESGNLSPVQWRSFSPATGHYQGEVLQKSTIQAKFRTKVERCRREPSYIEASDWSGLRRILAALFEAIP